LYEWRNCADVRYMLGVMMAETEPSPLDVVALLSDIPAERLARGQVGTVVE